MLTLEVGWLCLVVLAFWFGHKFGERRHPVMSLARLLAAEMEEKHYVSMALVGSSSLHSGGAYVYLYSGGSKPFLVLELSPAARIMRDHLADGDISRGSLRDAVEFLERRLKHSVAFVTRRGLGDETAIEWKGNE